MASVESNYARLMDLMDGMDVVDTHEHLRPEKDRLETTPDFTLMFGHYCPSDLLAAGMSLQAIERCQSPDTPLDEKWRLFEPYYSVIRDGSYCRAAHIAMEEFYGFSGLQSLADAEEVTKRMSEANKPGLYRKVLKEACHIRKSMNFVSLSDDPEFFAPVAFCTGFAEVTRATIRDLEDHFAVSCGSLSAYVDAVRRRLGEYKEQGMKGTKFHFAYMRDLHFAAVTHAEAEALFLRVTEEGYGLRHTSLGYDESKPLQDYMVHRMSEMAGELEVPVVIHTGLQGTIDQKADDARPTRLWNLAHRYRRTDFILLHAGFPWMEDAALLAKQYPNVYLDMAWAHLMSPEISTRALKAWVDLVPMSKIFGFGGDYCVVEKVYGHLTLAKQNIARALAEKMETTGMTLERAEAWIQAILYENPKRVYRLEI